MKRNRILLGVLFLLCSDFSFAENVTWYVRQDGGSVRQCTGRHDAPYKGGFMQPCAYNHPYYVTGWLNGQPRKMQGGDTLIIKRGSYPIGYDQRWEGCGKRFMYDCRPLPFPSGTKENPTKIYGETYEQECPHPPELWGTNDVAQVLNLTGSDWIEIKCLEVTDHSSCIRVGLSDMYCNTTYPAEKSGRVGLYAVDSDFVSIDHLNVHGMSVYGWYTGRLSHWTVTNSQINGNANAGWHADAAYPNSANSGDFLLKNIQINWNGCGENYPEGTSPAESDHQKGLYLCSSQDQGGYSDGIGMGDTGGNYIIEDSEISYNAQDGVDFLHVTKDPPNSLIIRRSRMEGNSGSQLKTGASSVLVENNIIISNCGYLSNNGYTATAAQDDPRLGAKHREGQTEFIGKGLNDAISGGVYSGDKKQTPLWTIVVDSVGSPDTFKWKKGKGPWQAGIPMSTDFILLSDGAKIKWKNPTGHTLEDQWKISIIGYGFSDRCRAGGEPLALDIATGSYHRIYNNSIFATDSAWNTTISGKVERVKCNGTEKIDFVNNILYGPDALFYNDIKNCEGWSYNEDVLWDHNIIYKAPCPSPVGTNMCLDPEFSGPLSETGNALNLYLHATSPARNAATTKIQFSDNNNDFNHFPRGESWDIGALEYESKTKKEEK